MTEQPEAPKQGNTGEPEKTNAGFKIGIASQQDMTFNEGGAFAIAAGRDLQMAEGGALIMAVGHDLDIKEGGALIMPVGGNADLTGGGAGLLLARDVTANQSQFGILISRQTNLEEGNTVKVLLSTQQALVVGAVFGVVFGTVFSLLSRLLKRK